MKSQDGRPFSAILGDNSSLQARTVSAQKTRLDCHISVAIHFRDIYSIGGKFSILQLPNGKWESRFDPLY
jgi:hypothetical protein